MVHVSNNRESAWVRVEDDLHSVCGRVVFVVGCEAA